MYTQLNQYHVVMEVEPQFWQSPDGLKHIYVRADDGQQVPLARVHALRADDDAARRSTTRASSRRSRSRSTCRRASRWATRSTRSSRREREIGLPASDPRQLLRARRRRSRHSLANEPLLILAALLAVYIVLGMLYESFIHPITILSTLPSAGVGALLALLLFQHRAVASSR